MATHRGLSAAIIGAGLMGRWHADAVAREGGKIALVIDPDAKKRKDLASRYAGARTFAGFDEAMNADRAQVAHVCTPPETHLELAEAALNSGMHVLVEKPFAQSSIATAHLLDVAAARDRFICPVHQFLYQPGVRQAIQSIPKIGPLLHIDAVACSAGANGQDDRARDKVALSILPHSLALLARVFDAPLREADWWVQHSLPGEIRATANVGGVSVSLLVSMGGRPTSNSVRFVGERGTVHVDLFHGYCVREDDEVSRIRKIAHPFSLAGATILAATSNLVSRGVRAEVAYPGLRTLIRDFYAAAASGSRPPFSNDEILNVASANDRLTELVSGASGGRFRQKTGNLIGDCDGV